MIFVETISGARLDLLNPKPQSISATDIAYHLSMICRFSGAIKEFYSVAQHSVAVSDLAREFGEDRHTQYACLMHDAAEAYIGDLPSPVKQLCPEYRELEERITEAINAALIVRNGEHMKERIKLYDAIACRSEAAAMMHSRGHSWPWGDTPIRNLKVAKWHRAEVEIAFLNRYYELRPPGAR